MTEPFDLAGSSAVVWTLLDYITADPPLSLLQRLNAVIRQFAESAYAVTPKVLKANIGAGNNAEGLAQLIMHCLLVDYKTTSLETAGLLAALGYKNTPLMTKLKENGGYALLSRHLIVYRQNNYVPVIYKLSNTELSDGLLRAFFAVFSAKKCHIIPELIYNSVSSIFVDEFVRSLRPEHIMDCVSIVHALCFIIGTQTYRVELHLGELMLELVKEHKVDGMFDLKIEDTVLNKVDVEKQKNELQALGKRAKIIQINLQEIEQNVKEITTEKLYNEQDLVGKKKILAEIKNVMIDLQEKINLKDGSYAYFEALQSNYKGVQNVYMLSEKAVSETEQTISQCIIRLKQKEQDKCTLEELQTQIQEQAAQIRHLIDSYYGGYYQLVDSQPKQNAKEQAIYDLNDFQTVKFSQVLFSQMIKFPEGFKYFCNTNELGYLFALRLSQLSYSPQLVGCVELVSDMLLIETPVRKNMMRLLEGKDFLPYKEADLVIFGSAFSIPLVANLIDAELQRGEQNLTYVYMFLDYIEKSDMQKYVSTSFVGCKDGTNFAVMYLVNAMHRFVEIGLFEAVLYQVLNRSDQKIAHCFVLLLSYVLFLLRIFDDEMYDYLRGIIISPDHAYENRYSTHQQLIGNVKTVFSVSQSACESLTAQIQHYLLYLTESVHQLSSRTASAAILPAFTRKLDWQAIGVESCPCDPLRWNWEEINFLAMNQLSGTFIQQNKAYLQTILNFISNQTPASTTPQKQQAQLPTFVLNSPIPQFYFDDEKFQKILRGAQQYTSFTTLPVCFQTTRIYQIAVNLISRLLAHSAGIALIEHSRLLYLIAQEARLMVRSDELDLARARVTISLIGALSYSSEGVEMLYQHQIMDIIYQIVYATAGNQNSSILISQFIMCISPAAQQRIPEKDEAYMQPLAKSPVMNASTANLNAAPQLCECGRRCLRSHVQNDLKLTILAFLKSPDVRIRYQGLMKLAHLLRKRYYYLYRKNSTCGCLCFGCASIWQQQMLISREDELWALSCLMPLINDVQAEIGISALCVVEEFISGQSVGLFIENSINLENWRNVGHFLQIRLAYTPEGRDFVGAETISALMQQKSLYRYMHNLEYKQFLSLTRQISAALKYPSYDKVVGVVEGSADVHFTKQDYYAYDIILLPHNTPFGRAALQIPEALASIPGYVYTSFWQDRSAFLQPTPFASSQSYSRGSIFQSLNIDERGAQKIKDSGICAEITENLLNQPQKPESVLFRGYIIAFAQISTTKWGLEQFEKAERIFDYICETARNCAVERCRYAALYALYILAANDALRPRIAQRFNLKRIRLRNAQHYLVNYRAADAVIIYNRTYNAKTSIFRFQNKNIDFVSSIQLMPDQTLFYTQPTCRYAGFCDEAGIQMQDDIKTDFSVLKSGHFDGFLQKNRLKDVANYFAAEIEVLRTQFFYTERQHLPLETQEAIKLCFVDNVADAQGGLIALRQGYQKNFQLDFFILLEISKRHVEPGVLAEIYDIIGSVDVRALDNLSSFDGEWV